GRSRRLPIAGANLGNVFYLRTLRDVQALREIAESQHQVVIVGGVYIALETASHLAQLPKTNVTLMHRSGSLWPRMLGPELSKWLAEQIEARGVKMMLNESLNGFEGRTVLKDVQTKSGQRFPAGLAIVALGT